ncbi:DedA family protein [Rathayibacter iranicus]|uniref:DedA family protein n=2 Tax=Rathayibacter iranicus TaxID=59737 RepID=A0AAD1AC35_9MICO|nr:DedA family protein [Rathayibacter iranicus]AZZ55493.1 DedA family protein [Rathayibacter iranicus]MWV31678.1 DedA family protein [Rathayibacter iranicus NCPPB 2253 = VKM Ac-1602]PPI48282.1 DedA family protein [Rathayibacter iranicus]PPI60913.1 DedA family protein [Rathayibacter iranicus]PPI72559.1 DedA family protein [Rathayibacter iranicus]
MNDVLSGLLDVVVSVPPVWRTLLAGLAIFFETTILAGLIVPGDTIVIVSATGVTSPLQFVALAVTVVIGALCGESLGFYLGRWFGPRIRASRLGRRLGEKNWLRAERYLDRRGGIAVFLSRFLPVLHSLIPLTVGMSGMRYRTFMAWTVPACVLWSSAYVGVGTAAAGSYRELSENLHGAGYVFVGVIVAFALLVLLGKKLLSKAEARHLDE